MLSDPVIMCQLWLQWRYQHPIGSTSALPTRRCHNKVNITQIIHARFSDNRNIYIYTLTCPLSEILYLENVTDFLKLIIIAGAVAFYWNTIVISVLKIFQN